MKLIAKIILVSLLPLSFAGCAKKENLDNIPPPVGLGGETWQPTAIDTWLKDSLTIPYNISVQYRWDRADLPLDKTLTPPDESRIIPAMSAIRRVWIDPYNAETGSTAFIKKYSPKQFKLVGSVEYNYNGTVVLGQAEGGNNIAFFDINQNFDKDPVSSVRRMIQTSHHEFAHILHQNVLYPQEFKGISARLGMNNYTATWFNVSEAEALDNGYITPYSMSSYDEDFVEMVANMLMEGRTRFNQIVAAQNDTAQEALRQKEQIVVNYFSDVWNIDFYSLQTRVQAALGAAVPVPEVSSVFGPTQDYNTASVDIADQTLRPQSAGFMSVYNTASSAVEAMPVDYSIDSIGVVAVDEQTMYLLVYIDSAATRQKVAVFGYDDAVNSAKEHDYSLFGATPFGQEMQTSLNSILAYFEDNVFGLSWYANPFESDLPRVKFKPTSNNSYFIGLLTNTQ